MNLKLVLSAVISLVLSVQSGADHLSGLNIEGRYASLIQAEHQRWLDGENPDGEFQHHQDFVDMFVALNNCLVNNSYIRECYKHLNEQWDECWSYRTQTMGSGMGYLSCHVDLERVHKSVLEFELQTFYDASNVTGNPTLKNDMKASQHAWEILVNLDCYQIMRYKDPTAQGSLTTKCSSPYYEDRIATVYSYNNMSDPH